MKGSIFITVLILPIRMFAQGPNTTPNPPAQLQIQTINYYDQAGVNNDINPIQTTNSDQQATPIVQIEQQAPQSSFFGSENNGNKPCVDCDEVKQAIKIAHVSSGHHHKKYFSMKKWGTKFSGRMNMKMRKMFAHRKKIRTSYEICFNWK